jgi:hypothetical protein
MSLHESSNKNARRPVSRVLSTPRRAIDDYSSGALVAERLVATYPDDDAETRLRSRASLPSLFGFAPGGVYHAVPVSRPAVRSYRTLSPLPSPFEKGIGGLLSVALSLRSPSPGVTRHRVSVEPGLSSLHTFTDIKSSHPTVWPAQDRPI